MVDFELWENRNHLTSSLIFTSLRYCLSSKFVSYIIILKKRCIANRSPKYSILLCRVEEVCLSPSKAPHLCTACSFPTLSSLPMPCSVYQMVLRSRLKQQLFDPTVCTLRGPLSDFPALVNQIEVGTFQLLNMSLLRRLNVSIRVFCKCSLDG